MNIGVEIFGKGRKFERPVVVVKRVSKTALIGIPLTSKRHIGKGFYCFIFRGRIQYAVISQIRLFSNNRIYRKFGVLEQGTINEIYGRLYEYLIPGFHE